MSSPGLGVGDKEINNTNQHSYTTTRIRLYSVHFAYVNVKSSDLVERM